MQSSLVHRFRILSHSLFILQGWRTSRLGGKQCLWKVCHQLNVESNLLLMMFEERSAQENRREISVQTSASQEKKESSSPKVI